MGASDMPPSPPASTELLPLDTVCASVTLTPMPTMAMLDLDMDMEAMAMVDSTAMARGPLMLRPSQRLMPGTDTVVFTATVLALAMVDTALDMAMARGPLMPRPSQRLTPGTDTALGLGYGGYGGLYGYGKRSADAEAKPWLGYGGLYGGWAYGVPALVAHPNGAVTPPYTAAQVAAAADHFAAKGKRSADAYYGYGGYGLGLGYGYGGYGYLG